MIGASTLYILFMPGFLLIFFNILLIFLAPFNKYRFKQYKFNRKYKPFFSLIVPAHNEEEVIKRTLNAFLETRYDPSLKEIIIVNDGSVDKTSEIIGRYASTIIEKNKILKNINNFPFKNIILVNRDIGGNGKAYASNEGVKYAKGEILFFIDADVQLDSNAFLEAAKHLEDPSVGALAGYVKITSNSSNLNGFLLFESMIAQKVARASFNVLDSHYIVPGGCAIFKKKIWKKVGGYSKNSLAEDTDLTWKVLTETNKKIRFDDSIVVLADEPKTLLSLWNQRVRWARGNIEVTLRHSHKIGKRKYGKGVTYIFPFWLTSILMPIIFILSALSILLSILIGVQPNTTIVLGSLIGFSFYLNFLAGIYVGKGAGALEGLISPGIVVLIIFSSSLFWGNGIYGMLNSFGINIDYKIIALFSIIWIISTIPLTYLMVKISSRYKRLAEIIQLFILGYWALNVTTTLHGYILEALGKEKKWIRTIR